MSLAHGGHLTHGHPVSVTGQAVEGGAVRRAAGGRPHRLRPGRNAGARAPADAARGRRERLSAPDRFRALRRASRDEVGATLVVDMAHIAGLVAAGLHPSPVPHAEPRDDHHAQDAARPARRRHPVPRRRSAEKRRQERVPRAPGRAADARHRRQGGVLRRGARPRLPGLPAPRGRERAGAGRRARRARLRPGFGRHRQPPDAGGPARAAA